MNRKGKFEEFNDGSLKIYGSNEEDKLYPKQEAIRYGEEVTSLKRYYGAKSVGSEIDMTIHIPVLKDVSSHDVVIIKNLQYEIEQIQMIKDTKPPILRLSLRKLKINRQREMIADGKGCRD